MTNFASYPNLGGYPRLTQNHLDWLCAQGVSLSALRGPPMILLAHGVRAADGCFEHDAYGQQWLAFPEHDDVIYWQPRSGEFATWNNRRFALGEDAIHAAATYSFGHCLNILESPLEWLRASRDGIVIVDWDQAFDRLRDVQRIAVVESLLSKLEHHLQPPRLPEIFVLPRREAVA
ncbi:hypothetical protein GOL32_18080 [Sinorhizobium medicae]|nr:hypothetical protein [Sinorhizobium medicae]